MGANALVKIKLVVSGSVRHILVDMNRLPAPLRQGDNLETIFQRVANIEDEEAKKLSDEGIISECVVGAWQVLYVPCGFLVLEEVVAGSPVYGLRQSILTKSQRSFNRYDAIVQLYKQTKKNLGKMEDVLALM